MNLGKQLLKIRKDNKMSQEDFAELFNVTRQTISSWENSKSYPDIETLVKISNKFHISLDILLKGDALMIKSMNKKIKNYSKWKMLSFIILILFIIVGIILYIHRDDVHDMSKSPGYIVSCMYEDEVVEFHQAYRKFKNYKNSDLGGSWTIGKSDAMRGVTKQINELMYSDKTFSDVYELVTHVKSLYEKAGATCKLIEYKGTWDYSDKSSEAQLEFEKIIEKNKLNN